MCLCEQECRCLWGPEDGEGFKVDLQRRVSYKINTSAMGFADKSNYRCLEGLSLHLKGEEAGKVAQQALALLLSLFDPQKLHGRELTPGSFSLNFHTCGRILHK